MHVLLQKALYSVPVTEGPLSEVLLYVAAAIWLCVYTIIFLHINIHVWYYA